MCGNIYRASYKGMARSALYSAGKRAFTVTFGIGKGTADSRHAICTEYFL